MARLNEQLLIGGLCRHDYSNAEPRQAGDTVLVSSDSGELPAEMASSMDPLEYASIISRSAPVAFRLKQEVTEFTVPDVSTLIMDHSIIENDLQSAVDYLTGFIELELIDTINQFENQIGSPAEGITRDLIDVADRMLFDKADLSSQMHIVVDETGWEQISFRCNGKAATFDISTPAPEYHEQMLYNAAFHADAMCLVTRKAQLTGSRHLDVESDGIGLTVAVIPGLETNSLQVRLIMLYAVGIFRKDLGIKIATIDTRNRSTQVTLFGNTTQQRIQQQTISLDELRRSLPATVADPNLNRLQTIVESLSDIIDDPHVRLQSAIKIMNRTDGLKPTDLIEACSRRIQRMDVALANFRNALDARFASEITFRESCIVNTDQQIEATKQLLVEHYAQRTTIQAEIEQECTALAIAESAFNTDLEALRSTTNMLSSDLTRIVTGEPISRKSPTEPPGNVTTAKLNN